MSGLSGALDSVGRARGRPRQPHPPSRPPVVSASTQRWARPAYLAVYDPDGRPRRLRGTTDF